MNRTNLEDVYNTEETRRRWCWKSLPRKTLAYAGEKRAEGGKIRKDRITVCMCANATGTHRLLL